MTLGPLGAIAHVREGLTGYPAAPSAAVRIIAILDAVGWAPLGLWAPTADQVTLVDGRVSYIVNQGTGGPGLDLVQANASKRIPYEPTGLGGYPALDCTAANTLEEVSTSGTVDLSSYEAVTLTCGFTSTTTAVHWPLHCGVVPGGLRIEHNSAFPPTWPNEGAISAHTAYGQKAWTDPDYPLTSMGIISTGVDGGPGATQFWHIRVDGVDIPYVGTFADPSSYYPLGAAQRVRLGSFYGKIGPAMLAAGPSPVPDAAMTQCEDILAAKWGL